MSAAPCLSGKLKYPTPQDAARAAKVVKRSGKSAGWHKGKLSHYRCPACEAWHIGHALPVDKVGT